MQNFSMEPRSLWLLCFFSHNPLSMPRSKLLLKPEDYHKHFAIWLYSLFFKRGEFTNSMGVPSIALWNTTGHILKHTQIFFFFFYYTNLQSSLHLGGLVVRSLPQGTLRIVLPQLHFTSTVSGHG